MDSKTEKLIISEYKKGNSSLDIVKIVNLSKPTILKVLNKHNLIRKRDRCKKINIIEKEGRFIIKRKCPSCNKEIQTTSYNSTIACRNHFNSIKNNSLCKPCSLKLQVGEGNPFFGKKHTKKTKKKISNSRKGKAMGENNSMSNPKYRELARKKLIEKWESGEMEEARKIMSETMKNTIREGKLKSVIKSKAETEIINQIKKLGYNPKQSHRVDTKICDIYIPKLNLIIEYNGDYWHCNPSKYNKDYFNLKKNKFAWELWEYDKKKLEIIKSYGYNLEVVWETDYKSDKSIINNIIEKYDTKFRFTPEPSRKD